MRRKKIISRNKNNNHNSNHNDLKDVQNHRSEKKRNFDLSKRLVRFLKYKHYTKNSLKQRPEEKNK